MDEPLLQRRRVAQLVSRLRVNERVPRFSQRPGSLGHGAEGYAAFALYAGFRSAERRSPMADLRWSITVG
jgi:hypothetical protein